MDQNEREIIDGLFGKLKQAEQGAGSRDGGAEQRIAEHLRRQPAAPYYMAQAILVQEHALEAAQGRIQQLEQELQQRPAGGGGGFLAGLFGGGGNVPRRPDLSPQARRFADYQRQGGGGFMAGAMQTALGVAGGVMLGSILMDAFSADEAAAAEPPAEDLPPEEGAGDMGADAGGDFGMDEF